MNNKKHTRVPLLQALSDISTAALAGAALGGVFDQILQDRERFGTNVGATLGLTIGLLGQLSKL